MSSKSSCSDSDMEYSESDRGSQDGETNIVDNTNINNDNNKANLIEQFTKKEIHYYKTINNFFLSCDKHHLAKMIDIIGGNGSVGGVDKGKISLRVLDWFVTKYSKKKIDCGVNKDGEIFDIRISYKGQLKCFKKRYFDPFRRENKTKKFLYRYMLSDDDTEAKYIETTIGQLNFFKWAITNNIIAYVETNIAQITKAMNLSNKEDKKRKKAEKDKKELDKKNMAEQTVVKTKTAIEKKQSKKAKNCNSDDSDNSNSDDDSNHSEEIVLVFD